MPKQFTAAIAGYVRLSRDDPDAAEPLEAQFALRAGIIRELAARNGDTLTIQQIVFEQESGGSIAKRPVFKALLERCERGEISRLYAAYQDRVMRGDKSDEQQIEDAFVIGNVTLITTDGVIDFGDENFDPLPFEVRALIARYERRGYIKKRRETGRQRTREGLRASGSHPYGFVWVKPQYEGKKLIDAGHFRIIPEQYEIAAELFRRIRTESLWTLSKDLTTRFRETGHPAPPSHRRDEGSRTTTWYPRTIRTILLNPIYAGFPASHKQKVTRSGKRVDVPRADWVLPDEILSFRHPSPPPGKEGHHWRLTTRAEQAEIAELLTARTSVGAARTVRDYLVTGVLHCCKGQSMSGKNGAYLCLCAERHQSHANMTLKAWKAHATAYQALETALLALPAELLQSTPQTTDRAAVRAEWESCERRLRDCRDNAQDLMLNRRRHTENYGEAEYDETCRRNSERIKHLAAQMSLLKAQIDAPDIAAALPLLRRIREKGLATYWQSWTPEEKRQVIKIVIAHIEMEPSAGPMKHARTLRVTFHEWIRRFCPQAAFPLPARNTDKNSLVL